MINTTNDHYILQNFAECLKKIESFASDESVYFIAKFQIDAYIKDQSKNIQQNSYDIFNEFYYLGIKRFIELLGVTVNMSKDDWVFEGLTKLVTVELQGDTFREKKRIDAINDLSCLNKCIDLMNRRN
jgi:hypothetical protein